MSEGIDNSAPAGDINRLADHLFRQESGKLVSILTSIFGIERLQLAEDVVQEALVRAIQTWPYYGAPKNPAAWLTQTAKNLALRTGNWSPATAWPGLVRLFENLDKLTPEQIQELLINDSRSPIPQAIGSAFVGTRD